MTVFFGKRALQWPVLVVALIASIPHVRAETQDAPVEQVVWQQGFIGRIGDKPVQLPYLQRIGDRIEGVCCYDVSTSQTDCLRLYGTWRDGGLTLDESAPDASGKQRTTGHWHLRQGRVRDRCEGRVSARTLACDALAADQERGGLELAPEPGRPRHRSPPHRAASGRHSGKLHRYRTGRMIARQADHRPVGQLTPVPPRPQ
jgi:hypothetical protein